MDYYNQFVRRIFIILCVGLVIGSLIGFFLHDYAMICGWIMGSLGNIVYFLMLAIRVRKVEQVPPEVAAQWIKGSLVSRLTVVGLVMVIAIMVPGINLLAVLLGLLMLKPAIYIDFFIQHIVLQKERR